MAITYPDIGTLIRTTPNKNTEIRSYFVKGLMEGYKHILAYQQFAEQTLIPKQQGYDRARWYFPPQPTTEYIGKITENKLAEHKATQFVNDFIEKGVERFGSYFQISTLLIKEEFIDSLKQGKDSLLANFALFADNMAQFALAFGDGQNQPLRKRFAGRAKSFAELQGFEGMKGILTSAELQDACTELQVNGVPTLRGGYVAVVSPEGNRDLQTEAGTNYALAVAYGDQKRIWNGEAGDLYGIKIVTHGNPIRENEEDKPLASHQYEQAGDKTVYTTMVLGKNALGTVQLAGTETRTPAIQVLDKPDNIDKYGQFITVTAQQWYAAVCLRPKSGVQIKHRSAFQKGEPLKPHVNPKTNMTDAERFGYTGAEPKTIADDPKPSPSQITDGKKAK